MDTETIRRDLVDGARVRMELDATVVARAGELLRDALLAGKRAFVAGIGASHATAQHLAARLVGRFALDRRPLAATALGDAAILGALASEHGFEHALARQVDALGSAGDVLVAIASDAPAKPVRAAVAVARQKGMKTIALVGADAADLAARCDVGVVVPSASAARIEECHVAIANLVCQTVDLAFVPEANTAPVEIAERASDSLKEYSLSELVAWRTARSLRRQRVAFSSGAYDGIRGPHLAALRAARARADVLAVGVLRDGALPYAERISLVAALDVVDAVIPISDANDLERVLQALRPDVRA